MGKLLGEDPLELSLSAIEVADKTIVNPACDSIKDRGVRVSAMRHAQPCAGQQETPSKMRDLIREGAVGTVPAWPPVWTIGSGANSPCGYLPIRDDGILESVSLRETELKLTMRFDGNQYTGLLSWHGPAPTLLTVEHLLAANLGDTIQRLGDLDV